MSDDVTITVSRSALEFVCDWADDAIHRRYGTGKVSSPVARVRAAIPEPEWEPTPEQVTAYLSIFPVVEVVAIQRLRDLHDVGLVQ